MFKIVLKEAGTTSTPIIKDFVFKYIPVPDYRNQWDLGIIAYNDKNKIDNKSKEERTGLQIRNDLYNLFLEKDKIDFKDVDYKETKLNGDLTYDATTITVDSTDGFSEQGRIRINNEEIYYSGKTATTFTGCTRAYRGTEQSIHSDNDTVSNKYKVIVSEYAEQTPIVNESDIDEFLCQLKIIEII